MRTTHRLVLAMKRCVIRALRNCGYTGNDEQTFCEQWGFMRQDAGQRRLKRILVCCAIGISIVLVPLVVWCGIPYCRVEIAIHSFVSNPSQAGTRRLIALLEKRSPTQRQGTRMLKLLLWPKVATRSAYPVSKKPTVSVAVPFYLQFHNSLTIQEDIPPDGQSEPRPYPYFASRYVSTVPHVLVCPVAPDKVGSLRIAIQYRCVLAPAPEDSLFYFDNLAGRLLYRLLTWMKRQPAQPAPENRWYQARFCVPVDVNIVEPAKAEQVQLLSNPELDSLMRTSFRSDVISGRSGEPQGLHVFAKRLPVDVAFHCVLELSDGTRIGLSPYWSEPFCGCAGRGFQLDLRLSHFHASPPGTHDGRFVLESDPNYAVDEPSIKSIWNDRLEFPIRFTVPPEPNTGG